MPGTADAIGLRRMFNGLRLTTVQKVIGAGTTNLFTITGGRITILGLIGNVGTVVQGQATVVKLVSTPTQASTTAADMCTTKDMTGLEAGTIVTLTGLQSDALYAISSGQGRMCTVTQVIPPGVVSMNNASAANTGTVAFSLFWVPADDAARVALA